MHRHFVALAVVVTAVTTAGWRTSAQTGSVNDLPNPYQTVENYFKLPEGRSWGAISAIEVDKDGRSIWIAERCGGNSGCLANPTVNPVLLFDASGKLVRSFGAGQIISPHGIHVDRDGNVWVTDYSDNAPRPARGAGAGAGARGGAAAAADGAVAATGRAAGAGRGRGAAGAADAGAAGAAGAAQTTAGQGASASGAAAGRGAAPAGPVGAAAGATIGHQVLKFSPEGKLLMALGKAGGARDPEYFYQPNDVLVAPNGDIFVAEGHGAAGGRILKFDRTGKFLMQFGKSGSGPGEFNVAHALAMDSTGRLFVGDRANNRVQIFDQSGKFLAEWTQFGRPSGIFIDRNDMLYVADSESSPTRNTGGFKRGIRIGSVKDGKVIALIPDPWTATPQPATTAAEGVAADAAGNVYGSEVTEQAVKRYVKR